MAPKGSGVRPNKLGKLVYIKHMVNGRSACLWITARYSSRHLAMPNSSACEDYSTMYHCRLQFAEECRSEDSSHDMLATTSLSYSRSLAYAWKEKLLLNRYAKLRRTHSGCFTIWFETETLVCKRYSVQYSAKKMLFTIVAHITCLMKPFTAFSLVMTGFGSAFYIYVRYHFHSLW